jgi:hypothetical protein
MISHFTAAAFRIGGKFQAVSRKGHIDPHSFGRFLVSKGAAGEIAVRHMSRDDATKAAKVVALHKMSV